MKNKDKKKQAILNEIEEKLNDIYNIDHFEIVIKNNGGQLHIQQTLKEMNKVY